MLDDTQLHALAVRNCEASPAAVAALIGDSVALSAAEDYILEHGDAMNPFVVGESYLIETQTLYYVGRVREIVGAFVVLEQASWVHWTGRKSKLAAAKSFAAKHFGTGDSKPRTEFVGEVAINIAGVNAYLPGPWELPTRSL